MTEIRLHGKIAQDYGDVFYYEITKTEHAIEAIDANQEGFKKTLMDLHQKGVGYCLVADNEHVTKTSIDQMTKPPKRVDIIPLISGKAFVFAVLINIIVAAAISYVLYLLLEPADPEAPQVEAATRGVDESFLFSNKANIAQQGTSVPLGYGRLRVGSHVIHFTNKNYSQNTKTTELMGKNSHGIFTQNQVSSSTYN